MNARFLAAWALLVVPGCFSGDFVVAEIDHAGGGPPLGGSAGAVAGTGGSPAMAGAGGEAGATPASCTGNALFVVGDEMLTRGDSAILDRLRGLGYVVSIISATMVTTESAQGMDFVFISRSVHSPEVMASFRDQAVGLFVTEYNLYASLGMTDKATSASGGDTLPSTELSIVEPNHPLAAGFSGTVTVLTAGKGQYGFGVPGGDAVVVANLVDEPQGAAIFAFEKGAAMVGLVAPARRVGYFLDIQASTRLTAEGWALFDAAAQWSAGDCATQ